MIRQDTIKVTTTGTAGTATGTGYSNGAIVGRVLAIRLNYHASAPATADVTITENNAVPQTLHVETNSKTDVVRYPRRAVDDNAETAVTYDGTNEIYEPYVVTDQIKVAVAQADALTDCVLVDIVYED